MPIAPEQQRLIDAMVGTWLADERLLPSPLDPAGGVATGRTQARAALEGLVVTADYAEERDDQIVFRGHGVYGWDAELRAYRMYWFDSLQPFPRAGHAVGHWVGHTLTFRVSTSSAEHRYVYDFHEPGYYEFRIEIQRSGGKVETYMHGAYVRQ
ncbi:MAG: DUF1579 family protein [Myxococcota bacterium]